MTPLGYWQENCSTELLCYTDIIWCVANKRKVFLTIWLVFINTSTQSWPLTVGSPAHTFILLITSRVCIWRWMSHTSRAVTDDKIMWSPRKWLHPKGQLFLWASTNMYSSPRSSSGWCQQRGICLSLKGAADSLTKPRGQHPSWSVVTHQDTATQNNSPHKSTDNADKCSSTAAGMQLTKTSTLFSQKTPPWNSGEVGS